MAKIKPFRAVRPKKEYAEKTVTLPYDVFSEKEAREIVKNNPESFLRIVRPEVCFPVGADPYANKVYEKAKNLLEGDIKKGILIREKEECYYVYRLTMHGRAQTGLVACFSVDDVKNNVIKKHENTRKEKEEDRVRHIDVTGANTGLVFLAYRERKAIDEIMHSVTETEPLYDFLTPDETLQQVWRIDNAETVEKITKAFGNINEVYIADGHHRCASSVRVADLRREARPGFDGEEEFNYFLAVAFPDSQLEILPYNRVVRDLNGLTKEEFFTAVQSMFDMEALPSGFAEKTSVLDGIYGPEGKAEFAMFLDGNWYKLTAKDFIITDDAVDGLAVSVLQNNILGPLLGIDDPRTDPRIDFVGGIRGLKEIEKRCLEDMAAGFALYPTTIKQLLRVTDEGRLMPPKSTWFEPKLQSGLFVHTI